MNDIIVPVKFDISLINKIVKAKDYRTFCDTRTDCEGCPLFYYEECEESFDDIKKELEK